MPTVSVALRCTGTPSTYMVVVFVVGSFTAARWCHCPLPTISLDQADVSVATGAWESTTESWTSRRFEKAQAKGGSSPSVST